MRDRRLLCVLVASVTIAGVSCTDDAEDAGRSNIASPPATVTTKRPPGTTSSERTDRSSVVSLQRVEPYELSTIPSGYLPPMVAVSHAYEYTLHYLPKDRRGEGQRLSVQVVPPVEKPHVGPYVSLGEHRVRDDAIATLFIVSDRADDEHARHGLTWIETERSRITIYAFDHDVEFFLDLANDMRRADDT